MLPAALEEFNLFSPILSPLFLAGIPPPPFAYCTNLFIIFAHLKKHSEPLVHLKTHMISHFPQSPHDRSCAYIQSFILLITQP
jgi:hypothetical protein